MGERPPKDGALAGVAETLALLDAAGIRTAADVLERSRCVRDLDDRSNHVLEVDDRTWFVKRTKRPRRRDARPREAATLERLAQLEVPTAALAFWAMDATHGAVTGTASLDPARPLDELLEDGVLDAATRRRVLKVLARTVARLHAAALHHKDLYLNHLYLDPADPDLTVRLIDVERVARHRRALGRWVVKDLAALRHAVPEGTITEGEMTRFLARYLRARDLPRRGVLAGLARRVRTKARRMARHIPRTPVGDIVAGRDAPEGGAA
ncbi:MAG: lipopolysaccharide kinase InaA family protein [Planctomycetota bacterium]|nr:lipopolysaccharide kinase InaA family protein [Planctomycetota bacterium]